MSPLRAVCIWGSESSTAKHGITKHAKDWKGRSGVNFTVDVMSGNEAAGMGFAVLKEKYDVLLIATSSYGDGESPGGYERFFKVLMDSANSESKPLEGMQHAVLGYGDTCYWETFQNVPRLSDKFLGECGSRRFVQRAELDASSDDSGDKDYKHWGETVFAALQKGLPAADSESVCDWTVPAGSIKMDSVVSSESWVYTVGLLGAIAAIGIGGYYAQAYLSAEATA